MYNRGVEKRNIFNHRKDWVRFHKLLYIANSAKSFRFRDMENLSLDEIERADTLTAIGAYVLMPNHFHILVKETKNNGISNFMEKLSTGYSMYFNKKYERVGPLFQGRFKATHIDGNEYLKYLFAYIHLNPIKLIEPDWKEIGVKDKKSVLKYLDSYFYSSYQDYCRFAREESAILTKDEYPEYFSKAHSFGAYIQEWIHFEV